MQDLVKRYFWVVGVLTVMLCAYFLAITVGDVVEAKVLGDSKVAPHIPAVIADVKPVAHRSKVGEPLASRDMFCSDCQPAPVAPTDPSTPAGTVVATSLPLTLIATSVSGRPDESFATILNTSTQKQGGYFEGDVIPDAGTVKEIHYKFVDFENAQSHRVERIALLGETHTPTTPPRTVATQRHFGNDSMAEAIADGVKKIDDSNYEISRGLVDKVLANPMAVARGARVVPAVKNGKANGFKLYAIRPGSVYSQIGLANGDTIHAINGFDLSSPDKALEVYTKVKEATSLQVSVTRRGKEMTINYTIK